MSDLIDRQRALDAFDYWVKSPMVGYSNGLLRLHEMLEEIPPATPTEKTGQWIPVSERLPKGYQRILVTRRMFHWANEPIEYTVNIESFSGNVDFVAWMPLPEPYKASPTVAESEGGTA